MEARLNLFGSAIAGTLIKHFNAAGKAVTDSGVPAATQELVKIRASQINGCGVCLDMHTKEAAHAGETSVRLNLVAAWREAKVFSDAERAALELAEQGTRLADGAGGVSDEVWANAAKHFDDEQLAGLVALIAIINAYNRLNVIVQQPAGDYEAGSGRKRTVTRQVGKGAAAGLTQAQAWRQGQIPGRWAVSGPYDPGGAVFRRLFGVVLACAVGATACRSETPRQVAAPPSPTPPARRCPSADEVIKAMDAKGWTDYRVTGRIVCDGGWATTTVELTKMASDPAHVVFQAQGRAVAGITYGYGRPVPRARGCGRRRPSSRRRSVPTADSSLVLMSTSARPVRRSLPCSRLRQPTS